MDNRQRAGNIVRWYAEYPATGCRWYHPSPPAAVVTLATYTGLFDIRAQLVRGKQIQRTGAGSLWMPARFSFKRGQGPLPELR